MSAQIRDPIHGAIFLSSKEQVLVSHSAFQRLRNIKQLGFADQAFPGATHSRYSHSLGAMAVATRIFDALFRPGDLNESLRSRMRQSLRLAMLFHDLGHAPLSHSMELCMPSKRALGLDAEGRANHEDYTYKLLTDSSFSQAMEELFKDEGVGPREITELKFFANGLNYQPILKQITSSECDADRMDYLQRDSFYCGVNYGKFDAEWLIHSLVPIEQNGCVYLGIKSKGIFSFEDFLLSRHHMFASVYLHHTPVIFEKMLQKACEEDSQRFLLPSDLESYVALDDIDIYARLRQSSGEWAKRIVERKPYVLLADELSSEEHDALYKRLMAEKIQVIESQSKTAISRYFEISSVPLYVQTQRGDVVLLESYTELFQRYPKPIWFNRIYVAPEDEQRARRFS